MIKVEAIKYVDTAQEKLPAAVGASCCDGADRADFIRCRVYFAAVVRALHSGGHAASALVALLVCPYGVPQLLFWAGGILLAAATALYTCLYRM